ncbi:DNA repair protein endonuclease SAE2/CtIP C-terminus-domain-containing protein [Paraphoma chrysanthemicola]|uniref:DNA repair protein endonuclease SAE2/CtIP C-terminus-domain-containing protein n=1 Tax=Paraphoma chrysanthemicola TaxID=798071 RepID=A0A8K0W0S9_9PLEO|nr:DNA repair protein endonuclease SAE2/CtIP C-terminus-domain-containing protein [Paraphoma chrysanthemicola]
MAITQTHTLQGEENQQILFNHIESVAVTNARLVAEVEELKQRLSKPLGEPGLEDASETDTATAKVATVPAEEHDILATKYDDLGKKYQDLSQRIKYLERKNSAVMQKNKDMKESVRAWQEYADRQSGKHKPKSEVKAEAGRSRLSAIPQIEDARPHIPSSPRSVATVRTPLSIVDAERSSPAPVIPPEEPKIEFGKEAVDFDLHDGQDRVRRDGRSGSITPKPRALSLSLDQRGSDPTDLPQLAPPANASVAHINLNTAHMPPYLHAVNPGSSQTTEDEGTEHSNRRQNLIVDDDDDTPRFVSTRSLKRKSGKQAMAELHGSSDGTPVKPFHIKEEPCSSPPNMHSLVRNETIDLDDPASALLQTPRHRLRNRMSQSNVAAAVRHSRSGSAPHTQAMQTDDILSEDTPDIFNAQVTPNECPAINADVRALSEPSEPVESNNHVLRHLDPNILEDPSAAYPSKRLRPSDHRQQNLYGIFTESGEEPPPIDENAVRLTPTAARVKLSRKLHSSISPQTPTATALQTPPQTITNIKSEQHPTPRSGFSRLASTLAKSRPRNLKSSGKSVIGNSSTSASPQWRMQAPEPRPNSRPRTKSPLKGQPRLREKPVAELKLQDFKPNPAYNQGYSYAFSETVRKRGDRMCLPGCTNTQCCGSTFRTFAEAQAPLPANEEEALLQDYLGEAYDNMQMTQMESQERQELVLQARTQKMAKEAGKHRQAYERRQTPPGFWRVDFPTTQEQQEDRVAAMEREKKAVQERWLEAQRKGGRFIFRDE